MAYTSATSLYFSHSYDGNISTRCETNLPPSNWQLFFSASKSWRHDVQVDAYHILRYLLGQKFEEAVLMARRLKKSSTRTTIGNGFKSSLLEKIQTSQKCLLSAWSSDTHKYAFVSSCRPVSTSWRFVDDQVDIGTVVLGYSTPYQDVLWMAMIIEFDRSAIRMSVFAP